MFIGREKEIAVLNEIYDKPGFQMTVIYGRRRIGKSKLITEFIKGKRASYYVASKTSLEDNVRKWSRQFIEDTASAFAGVEFDDLEGFFNTIYQLMALKEEHPEQLEQAQTMLMIPDYFDYKLTGVMKQEYTNATSTNLVYAAAKTWDYELISLWTGVDKLPQRSFVVQSFT